MGIEKYNTTFNLDDSVLRHIIIAVLSDLNKTISFNRINSSSELVGVDVPMYFSLMGGERYLREFYVIENHSYKKCKCSDENEWTGNYDSTPRGIIHFNDIDIDASSLVNKRIFGEYIKKVDNVIKPYRAEFSFIPITISLDVEILTSSILDSFKVIETVIKRLYKNNPIALEVGHLLEGVYMVESNYQLPESYSSERPIDYSFDDTVNLHKVSFTLNVNSFIPVPDFGTEQFVGNMMKTLELTTSNVPSKYSDNFISIKNLDDPDDVIHIR